jgi:hypothetical protein
MSKIDLVGKVINHQSEAFLVLKELDQSYRGCWADHPRKPELSEVHKTSVGEPLILANSLEEFMVKGAVKKADVEAKRKYLNKVCLGENSDLGIVTSYEDGICYGFTPSGDEWHCQDPVIVGTDLCDYVKKGIEERVREAL